MEHMESSAQHYLLAAECIITLTVKSLSQDILYHIMTLVPFSLDQMRLLIEAGTSRSLRGCKMPLHDVL